MGMAWGNPQDEASRRTGGARNAHRRVPMKKLAVRLTLVGGGLVALIVAGGAGMGIK